MTSPEQKTGGFGQAQAISPQRESPNPQSKLEAILSKKTSEANNIWGKQGELDARAFKRIIYERQAGSMNGPKNTLAVAASKKNKGEFLEENVLLHGLKSFGITIDDLLAANLANMEPGAYDPIKKRYKTQEEFVEKVQTHLQSPVVRNLCSIVNLIQPTKFGIGRQASMPPSSRSKNGRLDSGTKSSTFEKDSRRAGRSIEPTPQALATVSEEHPEPQTLHTVDSSVFMSDDNGVAQSDSQPHLQDETAAHYQLPSEQLIQENLAAGLDSVPETNEQESDAAKSKSIFLQKNFSVPKLQMGVLQQITPKHQQSALKHIQGGSNQTPLMSQQAIQPQSQVHHDDSSLANHIKGVIDAFQQSSEPSERLANKTPFVKSNYMVQPHSVPQLVIPAPNGLSEEINMEDYMEVYKNIIRKYTRRERYGKELTADPEELNQLNDKGYRIKAERYIRKREGKKHFKRQRSNLTGQPVKVRGDQGYESSTSSSNSSNSSVSYGGVPEADVEYLASHEKQLEINERRNQRRSKKWQVIFDKVVSVDIRNQISQAMLSQQANYENSSDQSPLVLPSDIQPASDDQSEVSPRAAVRKFAQAQAKMKELMDGMADRLKARFLEDIDEEIPEEYLMQKEMESQLNDTQQSKFTYAAPDSSSQSPGELIDPLEQIEQSINAVMQGLKDDIQRSGANQVQAEDTSQVKTVPSYICNQASFISARKDLSDRMGKFNKSVNTSPRFYDNDKEENFWKFKMRSLEKGKVDKIFPTNKRVESLQKFAKHLRSKSLVPRQILVDMPKGFNQNMELDQVMQQLGRHMFERSSTLKAERDSNAYLNKQSSGAFSGTPMAALSQKQLLHLHSSSMFEQSPSNATRGLDTSQMVSPLGKQSSQNLLLEDVSAVLHFFARNKGMLNTNSLRSLGGTGQFTDQEELETQKQQDLEGCIKIEKPNLQEKNQGGLQSGSQIQTQISPEICYCNHMAAHRHVYLTASQSSKEIPRNSGFASRNNQTTGLAANGPENVKTLNHAASTIQSKASTSKHVEGSKQGVYQVLHGKSKMLVEDGIQLQPGPASNERDMVQSSSGGGITPLGFQRQPMTDRNWNNSELKKFSVNQSKSNADIMEDLRNFKELNLGMNDTDTEGGGILVAQTNMRRRGEETEEDIPTIEGTHNSIAVGDNKTFTNTADQVTEQIERGKAGGARLNNANKKGKTFTVLYKSDKKHIKAKPFETPLGLPREISKDEFTGRTGQLVGSARYNDSKDVLLKQEEKKSPQKQVYKVNILQSLNHQEIGQLSAQRTSPARQQPLAVNVTKIELPDEYQVGKQQMPAELAEIGELVSPYTNKTPMSPTSPAGRQHKLHEVGLQTAFDSNTQNSFYKKGALPAQASTLKKVASTKALAKPQVVVANVEKFQDIQASLPTINNESSVDRLVIAGSNPQVKSRPSPLVSPKYDNTDIQRVQQSIVSDKESREQHTDTRLLIQSQDSGRHNNLASPTSHSPAFKSRKFVVQDQATPQRPQEAALADGARGTKNSNQIGLKGSPKGHTDTFKVKGVASKIQLRGVPQPGSSLSRNQQYHLDANEKTHEEVTATQGDHSQFEVPRPMYQLQELHSPLERQGSIEADTETQGTAYQSNLAQGKGQRLRRNVNELDLATRVLGDKDGDRINADLAPATAEVPKRTDRVVRNFKPSKPKRLPEIHGRQQYKLSQLADSNVTPLGLFNQDLHAKREWNKLVSQKHFSETLNDKQMSFKDALIHEVLVPISPPNEANKTAYNINQALPEEASKTVQEGNTFTGAPSLGSLRSGLPHTNEPIENSTQSSPESRAKHYKLYEKPRIQVNNENARKANPSKTSPRKRQQLDLHAKVPTATSKVIVFNFKGNQELSEEILQRVEYEQKQHRLRNMPSKALLSSSNTQQSPVRVEASGPFSPKRNSVNPNDSVSIYAQARAALQQDISMRDLPGQTLKGKGEDLGKDIVLKEERTRYRTTVRKRAGANGPDDSIAKQPTSLSTAKFLMGRRDPRLAGQMYSQKVSPFKPMGGGFKQNLNIEMSQERIEREVALQREKISSQNVFGTHRASRQNSNNTLDLTHVDSTIDNQQLGFSIERVNLNDPKPRPDVKDLIQEEVLNMSSKTKEKINNSALSRLNQQLIDFKPSENTSNDDQKSLQQTPSQVNFSSDGLRVAKHRNSKSSTDYHHSPSATIQNFQVPKMALMPKPVKEAIQTNDSFAKMLNEPGKKRRSPKQQNITKSTFARKKESTGIPYPIKSGVIGEAIASSGGFDQTNNFNSSRGPMVLKGEIENYGNVALATHRSTSTRLEGTQMKLSQKNQAAQLNRGSPFEKNSNDLGSSPRKRLSPKTLATIKGGTRANPIKVDSPVKLTSQAAETKDRNNNDSRMRTESRGLSQNIVGSRPDLFSKGKSNQKPHIEVIERDFSQGDLLKGGDEQKRRQVVGLPPKRSEDMSSLRMIHSRDEFDRQALTAKGQPKEKLAGLDDMQTKIALLDNEVRPAAVSQEPALCDDPSELQKFHKQIHADAEKHFAQLISQGRSGQMGMNPQLGKDHFISSVAGLQIGSMSYRKKAKKRSMNGLKPDFGFHKDGGEASLNRILGTSGRNTKGRNMVTVNMHPTSTRDHSRNGGVFDSKGTDVLLNMSTQNRDLQLSIGAHAASKVRLSKQ